MKPLWTMLSSHTPREAKVPADTNKKWRTKKGYTKLKLASNGLFVFGGRNKKSANIGDGTGETGEGGGKSLDEGRGKGGGMADNLDGYGEENSSRGIRRELYEEPAIRVPLARIEELEEFQLCILNSQQNSMKAEREQSMTSENEMLQSCFQCVSGVPEKKESWRELLYRFTQETTFHGVRYITDETPYILRRLLWILIVSSATALFTWFVVERIILLMRHPKAVDVEVIFNQTIDFPTVTVCNQNFFRKTAAHYYGLHDMIENGYQSLQGSNIKEDDNGDESVMYGFELKMDLFLDGIGNSYTKYVNITAQVCKLTCLEVVSDSCCSLVYNKRSKTCYITAMETQMPGVSLIPKKGFDYYRRKKCEVQTSAQCDFEQSVCNFVVDFTMVLIWKVTSNERRDAGKPTFDHTKMSTKGKYLRVSTAYQQSDAVGHLLSPYFLSGNNTCITFYYQIRSGTLNIKIGVQNELDVVWSRGSSASTDWELAFARLRSGYFRVVIEASSKLKNSATEKVDISIDDVSIGECPPIMECRTSPMALGYGGSKTSAESKNKCQPWNGVLPSGLPPQFWSFGNVSTSGNDVLSQEQNYCRNPDNDIRGPWCFTDLKTMQMEYCDIPYCPCRSFEFMCSNKRCIAKEQVCDNVNDCGDLTDERDCTHKPLEPGEKVPVPSVNCTFEQTWNCTYLNDPSYKPLWSTRNGGVGEVIGVDTGKAKVGDVASLVSPPFTIFDVGCLQFEFQLTMDEILEVNYKVDEKALYKHHLCTVRGGIDTEKHWYVTRLDLPPGTYSVVFDATIYSGKLAKLNLDNITVTEGNCTDPYDFNVTTESTETTLEYENETTTPIYISPTLPSINRTQDLNATSPPPTNLTTPAVAAVTNATENVTEWDNSTMTTMEVMTTPEPYVYDPACVWDEWTCGGCMQPMAPAPANGTQPECDEDIGITCQFVDDCRCGYRMTASNINWQWQSSYTESFPENVTVDMTGMDLFLEPLSETPIEGDWIRLFSPIMTIDTVSCVSFQYFTRYMDIRVLIYNEETVMEMMEITYDGQAPAWHPVDMTLTEGQWGIAFDYIYARFSEDNAGIDNITLTPGICDSSSANPSVNCTFDDPEWCGYKERSPKYRNWFRSQSLTQQGKNYIRTRSTEDGKLSRRLLSPDFSITQLSCLQFDYFGQGKNKELEVKTISATLTSSTGSETIWKIYGVIDNIWHKGKALIKPGRYTLRLDINGDSFRGGFDEILVTPGGCPQINCSETEYRCRSLLACIGMEQMCDGIINCPGGEDESVEECGEEDKTTDEDDGDQVGGDTETIDTDNLASEIEEITKLEELYWQVGHQGDDFIYKCEWDSIECSDHNFTKQVTDYGVCYTFNERSLNTSKTGARFGLRLTLNIEQYEYMIGPNTDAGIKMFLHAKDEVPQVRDLGFAISPGQHALVGIMRNEAENLEAPWGECDVTDLYYYDSYLYSRCVVDCETKYLVDMCQCRDAYMPNRTADDPPICNFTSYFDCAAPMLNKLGAAEEGQAEEDKCHNCPKPCNQTVYEPALSYALLSSMSVDQILTSEASILQTKYDNALETRQRTDGEIFVNDLKRIGALERSYLDAIRLSKEYLISDGAVFPKVLQVVNTINEDAFIADMNTLLGIINEFKRIYTETYEERKSFLFSSAEVFGRTLSEVDQLLYLTVKKNKVHEYLKQFAGNGIVQSVLLKETLEILAENLKNTTVAAGTNVANLAFMPVHFYQNPTDCTTKTELFIETLTTLTYDFKQIEKYSNSVSRLRSIYLDLQDNTRDFENEHMSVKACLNEYPGAVDDTISFREDALKQADNIRSHISSTSFDVLDIITDLNSEYEAVIQIYKMYISGVVKKMTMLQEVLKTEQEEVTPTQVITTFFSKIKTKVSDPLRQIIQETQTTLTSLYPKSLEKAAFLSNYLKDHFFYDNAEFMVLWREPIPNIDVPTPLSVNGTELWKVWDRTTLITDFVKRTENPETGVISSPAETEIKRILNYYFTPLLERIDTFEQQLSTVVNDLTTAVEEIDAEYVQYTARRLIDHLFVSDNFMNVDVYFKQLKFQKVKQIRAYELQQFLSDVGGYMGLLLGASVLTIFELLDLILYNGVKKYCLAKGKSYDTGGTVENGSKGLENNDKGIYDPMPAQTHAI